MKRHLSLRTERLGELTREELVAVAGATRVVSVDVCIVWPTRAYHCAGLSLDCLTGYYPSINAPCTTG